MEACRIEANRTKDMATTPANHPRYLTYDWDDADVYAVSGEFGPYHSDKPLENQVPMPSRQVWSCRGWIVQFFFLRVASFALILRLHSTLHHIKSEDIKQTCRDN